MLEINTNRSKVAYDLTMALNKKINADIVTMVKPNKRLVNRTIIWTKEEMWS